MESYIKPLGVKKQFDPSNYLYLLWINISKIFIKVVVEYAFGMHIGYAIGWVIGLYAGHSYVEHFEPVYLDDLSQLSSLLSYWRSMPDIFSRHGAMIGVAIGVIAIAVINNKLLNQRVTSLYKEGITNSNNIARLLGESVGQIERKINRLVKEGRISQTTILEGN
ncbi:MAG: hypothetical protein ACYTEW_07255 [Planctomycetota bacterium]